MKQAKAADTDARRLGVGAAAAFGLGSYLGSGDQKEIAIPVFLGALALTLAAGARLRPLPLAAAASALLLAGIGLAATGNAVLAPWLDATALCLGVLAAHRMGRIGADPGTIRAKKGKTP